MKTIASLSIVLLFLLGVVLTQCAKKERTVCTTCGTCSDGIQNQDETAIDCGGKCSKCASCSDGLQNQGEQHIDCGGPCNICPFGYPFGGYYGANIIRNDTLTIKGSPQPPAQPFFYSLTADVPELSNIKVIFKNNSMGGMWRIMAQGQPGWIIVPYTGTQQEFSFKGPGKPDAMIYFEGHSTGVVEIYQNNNQTPLRTRNIAW